LTTTLLGANGKLGAILACFAKRSGLGWRTQSRTELTDLQWSGAFDDPAADSVFVQGVTLINMIGYTGPDEELLHDINIRFVKDLLVKAADTGVAHVVLASSAAVYGAGGDTFLDEDDPLRPITPYGVSKSKMEEFAHRIAATSASPAITILRIGNIVGADALSAAANGHVGQARPCRCTSFPMAPQRYGPTSHRETCSTLCAHFQRPTTAPCA
jgi:UDP-glucose 4-epimerase